MTTSALFLLIIAALVVYGLERNHRRNNPPRLYGQVNVTDRDAQRAAAEITWAQTERTQPPDRATGYRPTRLAHR